jgi:hypothetical protein
LPSDKGLITRIYKELKTLNSPKFNDTMKKWVKELNRAFPKEEVNLGKKKKSLDINDMQIKTISRFHVTPVRMAIIKNTNNNKC